MAQLAPQDSEGPVAVGGVVSAMSDELAIVSSVLTDAIHDHLAIDDDLYEGTFQSTHANLAGIMSMLSAGADPTSAALPAEALAYAKEYVRRDLSLELLLRAYRTAQNAFSGKWLEYLRREVRGADELVPSFGYFNEWLFTWVETLERQLAETYQHEQDLWARGPAAIRAQEVAAILDGRHVDVAESSRRLRYELDRAHVAFVIWREADGDAGPPALGAGLQELAGEIAGLAGCRDWLAVPLGDALACWAGAHAAVTAHDVPTRLPAARHHGVQVAVGGAARGLEGFRRSHREALLSRGVARLGGRSAGSCVRYADVSLDALLTHEVDEATRFVTRELGCLADDTDAARRLRATLLTFLGERCSYLNAARRLGVHENTISYRVRRAEDLLGRRVGDRQLELMVALRLARFTIEGRRSGAGT